MREQHNCFSIYRHSYKSCISKLGNCTITRTNKTNKLTQREGWDSRSVNTVVRTAWSLRKRFSYVRSSRSWKLHHHMCFDGRKSTKKSNKNQDTLEGIHFVKKLVLFTCEMEEEVVLCANRKTRKVSTLDDPLLYFVLVWHTAEQLWHIDDLKAIIYLINQVKVWPYTYANASLSLYFPPCTTWADFIAIANIT